MEWLILGIGGSALVLLALVQLHRVESEGARVEKETDAWFMRVAQVYGAQDHTYIDLERDSSDDIRVKLERLRR